MTEPRDTVLHTGPRPVVGAALVLGAASLWATFGLFTKHLYARGFEPLELASVRAFVGFLGIAAFAAVRGPRSIAVPPNSLPFFAAYGILGFALFEYVFFAALDRTTVAVAVALLYTAPAFVVLASAVLWRERIGRLRGTALVLALAGVALVTGAVGALLHGTAPLSSAALGLGLLSGGTYALYTVLSKIGTERFGPAASLFWSFFFATLALAIVASPVAPLIRAPADRMTLLALGIVPTLAPYALYLLALRQLRASTAAMLASAEPAIATILAAIVLHEGFDLLQGIGIALIVMAAVLLARRVERAQAGLTG